jgi:hypothetical protein
MRSRLSCRTDLILEMYVYCIVEVLSRLEVIWSEKILGRRSEHLLGIVFKVRDINTHLINTYLNNLNSFGVHFEPQNASSTYGQLSKRYINIDT